MAVNLGSPRRPIFFGVTGSSHLLSRLRLFTRHLLLRGRFPFMTEPVRIKF